MATLVPVSRIREKIQFTVANFKKPFFSSKFNLPVEGVGYGWHVSYLSPRNRTSIYDLYLAKYGLFTLKVPETRALWLNILPICFKKFNI